MHLLEVCALGALALAVPVMAAPKRADIVDTAVAAGSFKTLVAAVQAAGLVDTLKGAGPFTVFAPTDEAFAKLPAGEKLTYRYAGRDFRLTDVYGRVVKDIMV